jgi:hypothetical protein
MNERSIAIRTLIEAGDALSAITSNPIAVQAWKDKTQYFRPRLSLMRGPEPDWVPIKVALVAEIARARQMATHAPIRTYIGGLLRNGRAIPYSMTGKSGLYARREQMPAPLNGLSKGRMYALAKELLSEGYIIREQDGYLSAPIQPTE